MKLQCQVEVVNRVLSTLNIRSGGKKHAKSTLALGKEPKSDTGYFVMLFTASNKTGARYRVTDNVKHVFVKCLSEGKATIRFEDPPHDLCIQSEPIQLKTFVKLLRGCLSGEPLQLTNLSNISVTAKELAPTKMVIKDRSEIPTKGLPRTLQSLYMVGLKLCNFRREILLLRHLTVLDLRSNELEKLPPELGRMPCISELYLANNLLGVRGEVDWRWLLGPQLSKSLRLLDLSNNALSHIPNSVWKLEGLLTLKLDQNMLSNLPSSLGRIRTLRYLSIFSNKLKALPCSLMQVKLEYIDLSGNAFEDCEDTCSVLTRSQWDMYVGSLVRLAAGIVLKQKIPYDVRTIPHTLVNFLDNSCYCVCGAPVLDKSVYKRKRFELKDFFTVVVFDNARIQAVYFDCYFCSCRCYVNGVI